MNKNERKCIGCGIIKDKKSLIKITKQNPQGNIIVNGDSKTFGRSAYVCYDETCIENAFKKDRIKKNLKCNIPEGLKGQLLNEL